MKLDVPYYRQVKAWTCGPACLRMALAYFGVEIDEEDLEVRSHTTPFGTPRGQLWQAARGLGFAAQLPHSLSPGGVEAILLQRRPLIAIVDARNLYPGGGWAHGVVIIGMETGTVQYHDPEYGASTSAPWTRFEEPWTPHRMKGLTLWKP